MHELLFYIYVDNMHCTPRLFFNRWLQTIMLCAGMYSKMVAALASIATIVFFFYYHHNTCCKKCSKHNLIAYVLKLFFVSYISSSAVTKK